MAKVIKDGKVGIIYSTNYGVGWYSWHGIKELLHNPYIISIIEDNSLDELEKGDLIESYCRKSYDIKFFGSCTDLKVFWIEKGKYFKIDEYDGMETIIVRDEIEWLES